MTNLFTAAAALAIVGATVFADTASIPASLDNTIIEHPIAEFSNGAGEHFFAGITNNFEIRRGLIAFDIASAIPAGSTINSVTLRLRMSRSISGPSVLAVHRALAEWGEGASNAIGNEGSGAVAEPGDATWFHRMLPDLFWTAIGGDFDPDASATQSVGFAGFYSWTSATMAADVQQWLDNPAANFGWLIKAQTEGEIRSAKRFDSRTHPTLANRPVLTVDFTPPVACAGDANGDGLVNGADLSVLLAQFGQSVTPGTDADFNGDGLVNGADLSVLLGNFGCP